MRMTPSQLKRTFGTLGLAAAVALPATLASAQYGGGNVIQRGIQEGVRDTLRGESFGQGFERGVDRATRYYGGNQYYGDGRYYGDGQYYRDGRYYGDRGYRDGRYYGNAPVYRDGRYYSQGRVYSQPQQGRVYSQPQQGRVYSQNQYAQGRSHAQGSTAVRGRASVNINPNYPYMGVGLNRANDGLLISRVDPGSPAEQAGLRRGDVVVEIDGQPVGTPNEFVQSVRQLNADERVGLVVLRDGREEDLQVQLMSGAEARDRLAQGQRGQSQRSQYRAGREDVGAAERIDELENQIRRLEQQLNEQRGGQFDTRGGVDARGDADAPRLDDTQLRQDAEADVQSGLRGDADAGLDADARTRGDAGADADLRGDADADAGARLRGDADAGTGLEVDTDADANAGTDADANAGTDADVDADADTGIDADADADADATGGAGSN